MNKNDISYCLFTSTKGHFERKDIYKKTVDNILSHLPAEVWSKLIAHIKIGPGEENIFIEMQDFLTKRGFEVVFSTGNWRHGNEGNDNSHQIEYIKDMDKINNLVKTNYFFHSEDDWLIKVDDKEFSYWLSNAQKILINDPHLMQIRIPRFDNEFERINLLKKKHGINARAAKMNEDCFIENDWSNNPYLARTRDMRAALVFVKLGLVPQHSEHGVGQAMKMLGWTELPLICFNPKKIRCLHIGTKEGDEDKLDVPTMEKLIE